MFMIMIMLISLCPCHRAKKKKLKITRRDYFAFYRLKLVNFTTTFNNFIDNYFLLVMGHVTVQRSRFESLDISISKNHSQNLSHQQPAFFKKKTILYILAVILSAYTVKCILLVYTDRFTD
jgi:hypothetical protein